MRDRCAAIREGGLELHKLLKDTNRKLKVSAGLPDWKNYVDFINSLVSLDIHFQCWVTHTMRFPKKGELEADH